MTTAQSLTLEINPYQRLYELAQELFSFIESMQNKRLRDTNFRQVFEEWCRQFAQKIAQVRASLGERQTTLRHHLNDLEEALRRFSDETRENPTVRRFKEWRRELAQNYETLRKAMKKQKIAGRGATRLQAVKLSNIQRNVFHACMGTTGVVLYENWLSQTAALWILGIMGSTFIGLEISRLFSRRWNSFLVEDVFGTISRPSEHHRINGSTFYACSLFLLVWLFPKTVTELAVLTLAYGDPLASFVGKRLGGPKVYRQKTLSGSSSFFLGTFLACLAFLWIARPDFSIPFVMGLCLTAAAAGMLVELFSDRLEDNLTIPILTAGALLPWF